LKSRISPQFRSDFAQLSAEQKKSAKAACRLFQDNPNHPSLNFKKLPPHEDIWSVRITGGYRAVGRWKNDLILWFFIGSHADYDKLIQRM
jgi:mRNA-degrading endonuclease RelE of RelBE toxin-antitoxin system